MNKRSILDIMGDVIFLKKRSIFSEVSIEDLKAIAAVGQEVAYEKDDLIVKEGDPGDSFA